MADWIGTYVRVRFPQVILDFVPIEGPAYSLGRFIFLRRDDHQSEQILSLLHEIYHQHPDFRDYLGSAIPEKRDEVKEAEIERRARETFDTRPDLVAALRDRLAKEKPVSLDELTH